MIDKVYKSIIITCQELENNGMYQGNSHHLAQRLSKLIEVGLLPKQKKLIYDALCEIPKSTRTIASDLSLSTKIVSAQLGQLEKCGNIKSIKESKSKKWYR